ncbi:MAG: hypothetical protein GY926_21015, partial [bacterium]|nr:hypothetical protein [bacterium]
MRSLHSGQRPGITVNDYAGHPFQIELSRELADRGYATNHLFCNTNVTPRADLAERDDLLDIRGLSTGSGFDKYNSRKRLLAETRYGLKSAWLLIRQRPAVTVL